MLKKLLVLSALVFGLSLGLTCFETNNLIDNTKNKVEKKEESLEERDDDETGEGVILLSFSDDQENHQI